MSADSYIVREALRRGATKGAFAALARLEAAETTLWHLQGAWDQERASILAQRDALAAKLDEREKWFAHAVESWKAEEQDWVEQRDALAEALRVVADNGTTWQEKGKIARAALAEAGLE